MKIIVLIILIYKKKIIALIIYLWSTSYFRIRSIFRLGRSQRRVSHARLDRRNRHGDGLFRWENRAGGEITQKWSSLKSSDNFKGEKFHGASKNPPVKILVSQIRSFSQIGFTTGLPAVYAYENGASEVALHCQVYQFPNFAKKKPRILVQTGSWFVLQADTQTQQHSSEQMQILLRESRWSRQGPGWQKVNFLSKIRAISKTENFRFDIILAPDLLNRSESEYEQLHDIINEAMAEGGIW